MKLSRLEFQVMEKFWSSGELSIREAQELFPARKRGAYTTIQTTVYRLEEKGALRRVRKLGNFHVFAATVTRDAVQRALIEDLMSLLGGGPEPVVAHLVESGQLSLESVRDAERMLRQRKEQQGGKGRKA